MMKFKNDNAEFVTALRTAVKNYFEVNGIEKYGGSKIIIKTIVMTLVYFLPYSIMLSGMTNSLYQILICWFVMGLGVAGIGLVTMHDANHGSFSKHRWVNDLFGSTLYLLGGFPANWKYQHNTLHHGYTNVEGHDEDIGHGGVLRFSPHKTLKRIHKYQYIYAWFFYGLMTFSWVTAKDFKKLKKYTNDGVVLNANRNIKQLFLKLIVSKVLYYFFFLVLPIILIPIAWYWVLLGFFIMHFTSGLILSMIFQSAHVVPTSDYPLPDSNNELNHNWVVHQLHTTCDFAPNSHFFSWLIGGLNYQVVHHLFPQISHVHYNKIAIIAKRMAYKYNLPYHVNNSFPGAIYQHFLMLKSLGKPQKSYISTINVLRRKKLATV